MGPIRRALLLLVMLSTGLLALAGCGDDGGPSGTRQDTVPAKICGLIDRDKVVALGVPVTDIRSRGQVVGRTQRLAHSVTCTVRQEKAAVVRAIVRDQPAEDDAKVEAALDDQYADDASCSQPPALGSLGTGYACDTDRGVRLSVLLPGRLVTLSYHPVNGETGAAAYARAVGLIGNLQENIVAFDQQHPTPSTASPSAG